ncbi:MAG: DUF3106 domain-containing protein [Pseudomonadota bacterium]
MLKVLTSLGRWGITIVWALGIAMGFSVPAWSKSMECSGRKGLVQGQQYCQEMGPRTWLAGNGRGQTMRNYHTLSPEEQAGMERNMQEWKSLPPETQNILRHRMHQWKELPPEDRTLYQKRYHQFQKLPPEERQGIREKLENWDSLSPQEQEEIRQKFPSP